MQEKTGIVFNIQNFSIHDGSGVRTVVFLKGCPLHCRWCANPESQRFSPQMGWSSKECIGCGECVRELKELGCCFKEGRLFWEDEKVKIPDDADTVCPSRAFHLIGKERTVEDVLREVEKDQKFYETSGGGLTVSGGEPMAQGEFTYELLRQAGRRHIHRCIETCGCASSGTAERIASELDMLYMDIKLMDPEKHRQWTGAGNEEILRNIRLIRKQNPGLPILLRTPVIPGFNDSKRELSEILELVRELGTGYEILRYHRLGLSKYESLQRKYPMGEAVLTDEDFAALERFVIEELSSGRRTLPYKRAHA